MDKGFESLFQNQQIDWQSTHLNLSNLPFGFPNQINIPSSGNMLSSNVNPLNSPMFAFAARKPEPCGWFYGLPRYRQGLTFNPVVNPDPKEQLPVTGEGIQKKFLVFDQSNDRTTLIYSSMPIQYHYPKRQHTFDLRKETSVIEKHEDIRCSDLFHDDRNKEESEMHEDSEELRALLYSDDEIDYSEDEEEESTGHSPSMNTGFDRHEWPDENAEEVASSMGCRKRRKVDTGGYDILSLQDTGSSGKSGVNCSGDRAELSICGNNSGAGIGVTDVGSESSPVGKRSRKERVKETISILQNLIPGGKNVKDSMVILDQAINYLRILKVEAKALGLDSL